MSNNIEQILDNLDKNEEISISNLVELNDLIEYVDIDENNYKKALKILLEMFFEKKLSENHRDMTQRTINNLILYSNYNFDEKDFEVLIKKLATSKNTKELCPALNMLYLTKDSKFLPYIKKFDNNENEIVRNFAKEKIAKLNNEVLI